MGKITDALEKFQDENRSAVMQKNTDNVILNKTKENIETIPDLMEKANSPSQSHKSTMDGNGFHRNLISILNPKSFESEQFRMLKSHILFPPTGEPPRSVIVTSALPAEGKSFVASNLAISIAQSINEYVLLVDCDIRKPTIHKYFGFEDTPGLSEYLSDGTPLSSMFLKTNINKLTILPAGKPPQNPAELLSSTKMSDLLKEVKSRYQDRYVIIDTPPPKLISETKVIAKQVDGVLIVIKYGQTPRRFISDLEEMFGKEKIIGVVFNMCSQKSTYYGYHKYSKYERYFAANQGL